MEGQVLNTDVKLYGEKFVNGEWEELSLEIRQEEKVAIKQADIAAKKHNKKYRVIQKTIITEVIHETK